MAKSRSMTTIVFTAPIRLLSLVKGAAQEKAKNVVVSLVERGFVTTFELATDQELLLSANVVNALNVMYRSNDKVVFFDLRYNRKLYNFSLIFSDLSALHGFVDQFIVGIFKSNMHKSPTEADSADLARYKQYMSLDLPEEPSHLSKSREFHDDFEYEAVGTGDSGRNEILKIGEHVDNAIVLRKYNDHCDLGLFTLDRSCKFRMAINGLKSGSRYVTVDDMMTLNRDRSLLMLDSNVHSDIHVLDMTRGAICDKIVSSFEGVEQPVTHFIESDDTTFIAFNKSNMMLFDPRASHNIVNMSQYKGRCGFTCGAVSRNGRMAMGSEDGIVRLYSGSCKSRATVNFQVSVAGDEITAVDISPDETWVLVTCPYHISVFNVHAKSTGKLGFDAAMGKDKPPLTRLTIKPEHQQRVAEYFDGDMPPFSSAKFESKNGKVVSIVAGLGTGLISWDFKRIESGHLPTYSIKVVGREAIIDNEPFAATSDVMFISDNQVSVVERK